MSSVADCLAALAEGALLYPMPLRATLVVTGADRQSWLNGLVTCDLKPLAAGEGSYGLSVNKIGRVQADVWIALDRERLLLSLPREQLATVRELYEHHLIMEDVELTPDESGLEWLLAFGPGAAAWVRAASARSGALGVTLRFGATSGAALIGDERALAAAAVRDDGGRVALADEPAWERVRIEQLWPRWGVDFHEGYAQEAALEGLAVSFQKGCYLGQEAVFMLEKRGQVGKRLVQLAVPDGEPVEPGAAVTTATGDVVGSVSSASAGAHGWLALATLKRRAAATGGEVLVAGRPARVVRGLEPARM